VIRMSAAPTKPPAKRPKSSASAARLSADASLAVILANLEGLDVEGLRRQWRNHLGGEAPTHLPRWLLTRALGHRLQIAAYGDLDKSARGLVRELPGARSDRRADPFERRDPQTREGLGLKPGALLVREWRGKLERVMALEEGFAWNGATYRSLSQVAKAMTGTTWNGHRFFGLRQKAGKASVPKIGPRLRKPPAAHRGALA
jgi:hypothetical protein